MLLLVGACMVGCSSSDANVQDVRERGDITRNLAVTEHVATTERDAQVRKARHIQTLSPELYEKMSEQEARLQEHGIPGYRPIYVNGYYRLVYEEPTSKKLARRGMTCTHPDCNGQGHEGGPFVFPDVQVDADGKVINLMDRCPACNRTGTIDRYSPPDVIRRRAELQAQLAEIRRLRDEARNNGTAMPTMSTSPREIMNDISNLPVLYFVEE